MAHSIDKSGIAGVVSLKTAFVITLMLIIAGGAGYYISSQKDARKGAVESNKYIAPPVEETQNEEEIVPPQEVTLDLTTEFARQHKTVLAAELNKPVNFDGHYRMALGGCGSACGTHKLLDKLTGKVYDVPASEDLSLYSLVEFSAESANLVLRYADGRTEIFRFNGTAFVVQ